MNKTLIVLALFLSFSVMLMGCGSKQMSGIQAKEFITEYQKTKYEMEQVEIKTPDDKDEYMKKMIEKAKPYLTESEFNSFFNERRALHAVLAAKSQSQIKVKDIVIDKIEVDKDNAEKVTVNYKITLQLVSYDGKEQNEKTHNGIMTIIKVGDAAKISSDKEEIKDSFLYDLIKTTKHR
ncbi:hypothetical protein O0550_23765 [Brevibacillus halotolerans]|uniref:hypothetical protein n=1 Tax=Brevibacillus TaxID=55080 RepID=UPI00215CFF6F|nr:MULTISPECIES: hypothetical protein [Brevibacillus]MCR8966164.1 hypothetical protein [Brevibacillus laterosporus]MCZ0838321.1 hypothetical protein [Brevibacillus halotolerans]